MLVSLLPTHSIPSPFRILFIFLQALCGCTVNISIIDGCLAPSQDTCSLSEALNPCARSPASGRVYLSSKFVSKQMNITVIVDLQEARIILLGLSMPISVSKHGNVPILHPVFTQFCIHYTVGTFITFWHLKKPLLRQKFSCFWTPSELGCLEVGRWDDPTHGSIFRSLALNPVPFSCLESDMSITWKIYGDFFPERVHAIFLFPSSFAEVF